ncbi:MAG: glycosyltransferase [Aliarcobacter sp.]|nr:glycosyltransferase [Aliarcobacter sp.]
MKFSILMSIYFKEKPQYFDSAMQSIWDKQTAKPNEIILVQDGSLSDELDKEISKWKIKLGEVLKIIQLEQNVGLGDALNEGMKYCSYELIARMDTDDISLPTRFEKQLKVFKDSKIDICSSWVSEFDSDEEEIISYRKIPETHNEIVHYSKMMNPINHPTVMYKKFVVENAGGYKKMMWFEDYYLWVRMILNGAKFYNIQEPLVNMRAGYGQLERRGGLKYAIEEFKFLNRLKKIGFLSISQFLKSVIIRFIVRILPKKILKKIYKKIRG